MGIIDVDGGDEGSSDGLPEVDGTKLGKDDTEGVVEGVVVGDNSSAWPNHMIMN